MNLICLALQPDLQSLDLNLTIIKKGGVRLESNSQLCVANDWRPLLVGPIRAVALHDNYANCSSSCRTSSPAALKCETTASNERICAKNPSGECPVGEAAICSPKISQIDRVFSACKSRLAAGCVDGEPQRACHVACAGGCTRADDAGACHTCKNVELNGICISACPSGTFLFEKRRCLSRAECHALSPSNEPAYKSFNGSCALDCPLNHETGQFWYATKSLQTKTFRSERSAHVQKVCKTVSSGVQRQHFGHVDRRLSPTLRLSADQRQRTQILGAYFLIQVEAAILQLDIAIQMSSEFDAAIFAQSFEQIEIITGFVGCILRANCSFDFCRYLRIRFSPVIAAFL